MTKLFLPSPRNSLETQVILLEKTHCKKFIVPDPPPPAVSQLLKGIESLAIPDLDYFLEPGEFPAFRYDKTFDQARYEPLVVLHTSGSSGIPKPITVAHGSIATMDAYHLVPSRGDPQVLGPSFKGTRMLMTFPMFHMASFTLLVGLGVYYDVVGVLPPAGEPLSAMLVDAILLQGNIQGAALPPSIIVDLYKNPKSFERLCELDYVLYAGGPLPKEVGDALSSRTHLASTFGSTETAYPPLQVCDPADWEYVSYGPVFGSDFRPVGEGLYEQWLVRQKDLDLFQSIFVMYPDRQEFSTRDLYEKHPTKADLWRFRGRADDLIVFSNAEKFNPTDFETVLSMFPMVKSALVGGQGRFQPFLLIEPGEDLKTVQARREYGESVWLLVEKLNETSPACGQIMKDFILLSEPGRPFPRAGKGTVQRKAAFRLYQKEIDNLYIRPELPKMPRDMLLDVTVDGQTSLLVFMRKLVRSYVMNSLNFNDEADFFDLGLDSLHVVDLAKRINAYIIEFELDLRKVESVVIYARPSIRRLVAYVEGRDNPNPNESRESRMQTMFDKYSTSLRRRSDPKAPHGKNLAILMTGSTGSLGSYILDLLIKHPEVARIYCTTRDQAGPAAQKKRIREAGLGDLNLEKVKFVPCDLARYRLGLAEAVREEVLDAITHVLHLAWDVNFNRSLGSFEDINVAGVSNLLDLSLEAKHHVHFLFTSTFATATEWGHKHDHTVPEKILDDWTAAQEMGYAESKLVAEQLIDQCGQRSPLKTTICRLGQIGGPSKGSGSWKRDEWIPSMVASSMHLGLLPESLGPQDRVDWIPVDKVARIVIDILAADLNVDEIRGGKRKRTQSPIDGDEVAKSRRITRSGKAQSVSNTDASNSHQGSTIERTKVLQVVNPSATTWSAMCDSIQSSSKTSLDRVDFSTWLEALRESAPEHMDRDAVQVNPALKLLKYLELLLGQSSNSPIKFETSEAERLSPTMASLGPVTGEQMATWMRQW